MFLLVSQALPVCHGPFDPPAFVLATLPLASEGAELVLGERLRCGGGAEVGAAASGQRKGRAQGLGPRAADQANWEEQFGPEDLGEGDGETSLD